MIIKLATVKKGPKGISDFRVFFLKIIKTKEISAPNKKARNTAANNWRGPKNKPSKNPILTSPIPIHFSFEIKTKKRKNPPKTSEAAKDEVSIENLPVATAK